MHICHTSQLTHLHGMADPIEPMRLKYAKFNMTPYKY